MQPLDRLGGTGSLTAMFVAEMARRMGLALVVMLASAAGSLVGTRVGGGWWPFGGAIAGLVLGGVAASLAVSLAARRRP